MDKMNLLQRERLMQLYNSAVPDHVRILTAGAGYGKTQTVRSFVSGQDAAVIWMSLSTADNIAEYFWEHFHNAAAAAAEEPVILVFDNCHLIREENVCDILISLVEAKTKYRTIFLLSRPGSLLYRRFQQRERAAVIWDEDTLAFTREEILLFLNINHLPLPSAVSDEIYKRTDGWPLAIYSCGMYLKEHPAEAFADSYLLDSLLAELADDEICSRYSQEKKEFLTRLALLERIPVSYIEEGKAEKILLRRDEPGHFYQMRYPFLVFFRQQTEKLEGAVIQDTLRSAGEWFLNNGHHIEALRCYEHLEDREGMWRIAWSTLISRQSPSRRLIHQLLRILHTYFMEDSVMGLWTQLLKGVFHSFTGDYEKAESCYEEIRQEALSAGEDKPGNLLLGETLVHQAILQMQQGDTRFRDSFSKAAGLLPDGSKTVSTGYPLLCNGIRGSSELWLKALADAAPDMDHLLHKSMHGMDILARAQTSYYRGDIYGAEQEAMRALQMAEKNTAVYIVGYAYFLLLKINMFKGSYIQSIRMMQQLHDYMEKNNKNPACQLPEIAEGFFYSQVSQESWPGDRFSEDIEYSSDLAWVVKAHYLLRKGHYGELFAYLDRIEKSCRKEKQFIGTLYIHLLYSIGYYQTGENEKAAASFRKVYEMAYENHLIMPIVEMGRLTRNMLPFLQKYTDEFSAEWLHMLTAKANTYRKRMQWLQAGYAEHHTACMKRGKLTRREKEVMVRIADGLTRPEIAEETGLALNTVKSITRTAFSKLGAANSSHAVYLMMKDYN